MSRRLRLLIGALTVAPLVAATVVRVDQTLLVIAVLAGVVIVNFSYLLHVSANDELSLPRKLVWAAVIVAIPIAGALVYWYRHVWRA